MVKQQKAMKTSSKMTHPYDLRCSLRFVPSLPDTVEQGWREKLVALLDEQPDQSSKDLPHVALVNMHKGDREAALRFSDRWRFRKSPLMYLGSDKPVLHPETGEPLINEGSPTDMILDGVDTLQKAWKGEFEALSNVTFQAECSYKTWVFRENGIVIVTDNIWSFICALFLKDYCSGKTGICGNPECPMPFFVKNRRTQKFCDLTACAAYAQRRYSLQWWHREGKVQRKDRYAEERKRLKKARKARDKKR